ncbi:anti-sigma factor family protein [Erwinia oleae]|uniref:anti-sigma factor family protein n=1 Tax=Erwinia oleae TaxID=796334 RepID=UPI00055826AF|nr:anti-sigma factor [Erwinia oleae]
MKRQQPDEAELHAWLDGQADADTTQRVVRWLAEHPATAAELEGWRQDARQLRLAIHQHQPTLETPPPALFRQRLRRQRQWKMATAFALVLTLSLGGWSGWQLKDAQLAGRHLPMEDAVQAFRIFGRDGGASLDVTAGQGGELAAWVRRYFINGSLPPNLEQFGFRLLGARLTATNNGPAALVMYQDPQGMRVAWYIRPIQPVRLPHGERRASDLMAQYWSDNHYNYALVTPAASEKANGLRNVFRQTTS